MKKLLFKSVICLLAIVFIVNFFCAITYAEEEQGSNFEIETYNGASSGTEITGPVEKIAGVVLGAIRIIGAGVAIIMIAVVAMKYMSAAPGDRADLKKSSIQYVVGALFVLGSTQIVSLLVGTIPGLFGDK